MNTKVCVIIGHRADITPVTKDGESPMDIMLYAAITTAVRQAIAAGITVFRLSAKMGFNLWCAEVLCLLKREYPFIQIHVFLRSEAQVNEWPGHWLGCYFNLLTQADEVFYLPSMGSASDLFWRNRAIVDGSYWVIACYDGRPFGETAYTICYANERGIPVRHIMFP